MRDAPLINNTFGRLELAQALSSSNVIESRDGYVHVLMPIANQVFEQLAEGGVECQRIQLKPNGSRLQLVITSQQPVALPINQVPDLQPKSTHQVAAEALAGQVASHMVGRARPTRRA